MCNSDSAPIFGEWRHSSLVWGQRCGSGQSVEQTSPVDGRLIQQTHLLTTDELTGLLRPLPPLGPISMDALRAFCSRLHAELSALYPEILEANRWETAFTRNDAEEVVQSTLEYVAGFPDYMDSLPKPAELPLSYESEGCTRTIRQLGVPWGTVAAILPQNAFMYLAVTCMLNALATGNRVILRAPTQSARSAALLGVAIWRAEPIHDWISVVLVSARTFLTAVCESSEPCLIHYLGSSSHAPDILSQCFHAGKQVLIDGEGNCWVWIDEDVPLDDACDILTSGALRYNGQTCTSINGAVVHPNLYERLLDRLTSRWSDLVAGSPLDADVDAGPLAGEEQAEHCLQMIRTSGGSVVAGGSRSGSLLYPTLAVKPREDSELVSHGLFGPALWIMPGDLDRFSSLWTRNRYPLCAGILTSRSDPEGLVARMPGLSRLTINGDPSMEYMYEPWGGYPSSGANPVSHWYRKYLRTVQVDVPA